MNSQEIILKYGEDEYILIEKEYFETEIFYKEKIKIVGTIDLQHPQTRLENGKKQFISRNNGKMFEIKNTFPSKIAGYLQINQNEYVRVEALNYNDMKFKGINPHSELLYKYQKNDFFKILKKDSEKRPAVFLDIDNVFCRTHTFGFQDNPVLADEECNLLKDLHDKNYKLIVLISNEEIEKQACTKEILKDYIRKLINGLNNLDVIIDGIYLGDNVVSMIMQADSDFNLLAKGSILIGGTKNWNKFVKNGELMPTLILDKIEEDTCSGTCENFKEALTIFFNGTFINKIKQKKKLEQSTVSSSINISHDRRKSDQILPSAESTPFEDVRKTIAESLPESLKETLDQETKDKITEIVASKPKQKELEAQIIETETEINSETQINEKEENKIDKTQSVQTNESSKKIATVIDTTDEAVEDSLLDKILHEKKESEENENNEPPIQKGVMDIIQHVEKPKKQKAKNNTKVPKKKNFEAPTLDKTTSFSLKEDIKIGRAHV